MPSGTVLHVCISDRKGTTKTAVLRAVLREEHGIEGDAHAGPGHRQVSLLSDTDIDAMRACGLDLQPGAFGENLVVTDLALDKLGIGTGLRVGPAELEITQIGKVCHQRCEIFYRAGDCIMPRAGLFARVVAGGEVAPGAQVVVTAPVLREVIQAAVLTVSDRCAAGLMQDTAGPAVATLLERELGAHVAGSTIVPDDVEMITVALRDFVERGLDLVATVGGTGCGPRDMTPEATRKVIAREVPGLAEAMRASSARQTPHALLQRGICGISEATLILNLPGSCQAAVDNLAAVLRVIPHAVTLLRGETSHPQAERRVTPGTLVVQPHDEVGPRPARRGGALP
jgi:molybdenum cofactor synthesis domain-containing protein